MDLFVALSLEENQRRKAQEHDPILLAADCELAESVGDGNMLQECVTELNAVAPNEPDTKRALALLAERCPPWRFWNRLGGSWSSRSVRPRRGAPRSQDRAGGEARRGS